MWPVIAAAGIGMISNYLSAQSASESASDTNKANQSIADQQMHMQREFAKNGIQWRADDARAAGINPLAALGAQTTSFSPVGVGHTPDNSKADMYRNMGQDLTRAVSQVETSQQKEQHQLQTANQKAELDGKTIDNAIKVKQLQQMNTGPSMPGSTNFIPGQGNSGGMKINPSERTGSAQGRPAQQAGWVPDVGYARTDTGLTPVPSKDVKERIEDQFVPELAWAIRNYAAPNLGAAEPPPTSDLPKGASEWKWSHPKQEWQPVKTEREQYKQPGFMRKKHWFGR